ncbi:flagellar filament capping protein FliD [Piscinibacter defluvii]|uniref:flagellar filament capping protein FliD n=1 Tax=Piscinibacter defluvii TaxID=1796922 RepID=UPI000FDD97F4|nr:flagellar filament capping protein FliD [Piscinibacter defluvii]
MATSSSISSLGVGSGLDVNSIITGLMAIERRPLNNLESAEKTINTQISEVGKIKSALSKFRDLAGKLAGTDFWKQTTGSSGSTAVGVTTDGNASTGSYSVQVNALASAQSIATSAYASSSALVGAGTLTLETGTWGAGQTSFTGSASTAVEITADDTLASVRDKINASGAAVTASILSDANGARLVIRSKDTGAANAFRTSVSAGGPSALAYDPSSGVNNATRSQTAADASATINGLAVTSASNSLVNVLDGMTLTLNEVTTTAVTVNVKSDTEAMKKTLQDFAAAYSELTKLIATDTKYDATSKSAGPLQGDGAIVGLQNRLRAMLGASSGASSAYTRLSDVGFEIQRDGSLSVNATRLDKALANLPELKKLFANSSTTDASLDGFGKRFRVFASDVLGVDGTLTTRSDGLAEKLKRNQDAQERLEDRLAQVQKRLEAQYTALDAQMGKLNGLSSYVTQQIAAWNKA